jgi:DNA-binding NarL/FixJ family response regulator
MDRDREGATVTAVETTVRIVIADDQTSVREGLVLLLGMMPGIEVVGSAANGREAVALVAEHHPDAILLDLHMPILDGVETTKILTAEQPDVAIVILTTYVDDTTVLAALRAGARSYLTKDADRAEIARAVHAAAQGLSVLDAGVHAMLLAATTGTPPAGSEQAALPDGLTAREGEILTMIAGGMTNREIADALFLSGHTIKTHINHIFAKTASRDRAAATRYAQSHNLI